MQYGYFYSSQLLIIFTKAGKQSGGSTKISNSYVIPIRLCNVVYSFFLLNRSIFLIVLLRLILNCISRVKPARREGHQEWWKTSLLLQNWTQSNVAHNQPQLISLQGYFPNFLTIIIHPPRILGFNLLMFYLLTPLCPHSIITEFKLIFIHIYIFLYVLRTVYSHN